MKHVRLIRHGSSANADEASLEHATIPLTSKGVEQAYLVAQSFNHAPALVVASPFSRSQATAMAALVACPTNPLETWPIHELTYLEPVRCSNTTVAERRDWVEAYWSRSDPAFRNGEGAESFLDSHEQFMNAVAFLIERKPETIDGRVMADWREYEITNPMRNCCGYLVNRRPADHA